MKKCKKCSGRGFLFDKIEYRDTINGLTAVNVKYPCTKCYGRG